jgi:hypothetical protein
MYEISPQIFPAYPADFNRHPVSQADPGGMIVTMNAIDINE